MTNFKTEYAALTDTAGFVELPARTLVRMAGEDRHKFLHNFCTADVNGLKPGQLTEAFVLNEKGKTLSHLLVLALQDEIFLSGAGDQAAILVQHLDKFIIREDVTLTDLSREFSAMFVCGSQANQQLEKLVPELPEPNGIVETSIDSDDSYGLIAHADIAGPGFLLLTPAGHQHELAAKLIESGIQKCCIDALQIVRIENQTPWFGLEIDESNLPQELRRDELAISFEKGCYLGQETVARIDALGHVNRLLVGLKFDTDTKPDIGTELFSDTKPVGRVTSVAPAADHEGFIGLGFVKRAKAKVGTELEFANETAVVV